MTEPFASPRAAARALLMLPEPKLTRRSGQFCGGLMFDDEPLTEKQQRWLADLLQKNGLGPLVARGGHG